MNTILNVTTPTRVAEPAMRPGAPADGTNVVALHPDSQNLSHTLRFLPLQDGSGRTVIQVLDGQSGRIIRQIPWDAEQPHDPGWLLNARV